MCRISTRQVFSWISVPTWTNTYCTVREGNTAPWSPSPILWHTRWLSPSVILHASCTTRNSFPWPSRLDVWLSARTARAPVHTQQPCAARTVGKMSWLVVGYMYLKPCVPVIITRNQYGPSTRKDLSERSGTRPDNVAVNGRTLQLIYRSWVRLNGQWLTSSTFLHIAPTCRSQIVSVNVSARRLMQK